MQGHLRNKPLTATVTSECAQTRRPLELVVGSDLSVELRTEGATPVVSIPMVDFKKLGVDVIYDAL